MSIVAVITVDSDTTPPVDSAICSIQEASKDFQFKTVVIKSPSGTYAPLPKTDLPIVLIADDVPVDDCTHVVYLHPNARITAAGWTRLRKAMKRNPQHTHYSMRTQLVPPPTNPSNVWFIVLCFIDFCWALFDRGKHPAFEDVRVEAIYACGKRRYVARRQWYWRIWNADELPAIDGGATAVVTGVTFAQFIRSHPYFLRLSSPLGAFWFVSWYLGFGVALMGSIYRLPVWLIAGGVVAGATVITLAVGARLKMPFLWITALGWPLYLALLPLVTLILRAFF